MTTAPAGRRPRAMATAADEAMKTGAREWLRRRSSGGEGATRDGIWWTVAAVCPSPGHHHVLARESNSLYGKHKLIIADCIYRIEKRSTSW